MSLVHVGRQPIYDRSGSVAAYELLFRGASDALEASQAGAYATSRTIVNAFAEFGITELVGTKPCFINVTREFLVGELDLPFEPTLVRLEIPASVPVDDAVVEGATRLTERGFELALDGFTWGTPHERLLPLARYAKLDLLRRDADDVAGALRGFTRYPHLDVIAERLETEEMFLLAFRLGFALFQGYVLGRPHVLSRAALSPTRTGRLRLLATLGREDVDVREVAELVATDPAVGFRLLHASNAAASGLPRRVTSVTEAVMLLGLTKVRAWVTLMLLGELTDGAEDLVMITLTRARLCQLLADTHGVPSDAAFTVGMLSGVAELLGQAPAAVVAEIPLAEPVADALVHGDNPLGELLELVCGYERGRLRTPLPAAESAEMTHAYLSAMRWTTQLLGAVAPA